MPAKSCTSDKTEVIPGPVSFKTDAMTEYNQRSIKIPNHMPVHRTASCRTIQSSIRVSLSVSGFAK